MQEQETHSPSLSASIASVHPSIVQAICKIQRSLEHAVAKKGHNTYGKYAFVSVDDVFATLAKRMGEAELSILTLEQNVETERVGSDGKTALFATFAFQFVLATPEGTWSDPKFIRTVRTQVTGPQSYAAAQSFAEKALLRSVFKLPTGDAELDEVKQADTIEEQAGVQSKPKRKSSAAAKRDKDDVQFNTLKTSIQKCRDSATLNALYKDHVIDGMAFGDYPKAWAELLEDEYAMRLQDLEVNGA